MTARTATMRARDALNARRAAGGRDVRAILSPAGAKALESLVTATGRNMTEVIDAGLQIMALRLKSPEEITAMYTQARATASVDARQGG